MIKKRSIRREIPVSAFIDVVGIRDAVKHNPNTAGQLLSDFRGGISYAASELFEKDKLFYFSDCLFLSIYDDLPGRWERLVKFVDLLRLYTFRKGVFFRGAAGEFELMPVFDESLKGKDFLKCYWHFGDQAATLYSFQEQLKGIGVFVSRRWKSSPANWTCRSVYLKEVSADSAITFDDIRLHEDCRARSVFEQILNNTVALKGRHGDGDSHLRIGRYYLSLLVTWAKSVEVNGALKEILEDDYEGAERAKEFQDRIEHFDPLLRSILDGTLRRRLGRVKGFEQVFFSFVELFFSKKEFLGQKAMSKIEKELRRNGQGMDNSVRNVPLDICSSESRKAFLLAR